MGFAFNSSHSVDEVRGAVETRWRLIPGLLPLSSWMGAAAALEDGYLSSWDSAQPAACLHHKKSIVRPLGEMLE